MYSLKKMLRDIKWLCKTWLLFRDRGKNETAVIMLATPTHGNLGDQAIVYAEQQFLKEKFPNRKIIEVPNNYYVSYPNIVKKFIYSGDVIIIDGGGNLGSLWEHEDDKITSIIQNFSQNKIIMFPQTCYYDESNESQLRKEKNRIAYNQAADLTVMLRDRASFELFRETFPMVNAMFIPDIVLSLSPSLEQQKRDGIMICFRQDKEKCISDCSQERIRDIFNGKKFVEFTTIVDRDVGSRTRTAELEKKWNELAKAELLICDRLHAMIFGLITKTPCVCLDNVSKKVSGTYEWIKKSPYVCVVDSPDDIRAAVEKISKTKDNEWIFQYPFEKLNSIEWGSVR